MQDVLTLYHTGYREIRDPDIRYGRKNADFGQGFYLSDDEAFSKRWARERRGESVWLNRYTLDTAGLRIKRFIRDEEWFEYILANRSGHADSLTGYDVIIGPIANDTIYDTWGITSSGLLSTGQVLRILMIGPVYDQIVIRSDRAAAALRFESAEILSSEEIAGYRDVVPQEEEKFQEAFAQLMDEEEDAVP